MIKLLRDKQAVHSQIKAWQKEGLKVGLVPTMGSLHDGHLALMRQAAELADRVVVSIYVNPAQFGPAEDFERYPRALEADLEKMVQLAKVHVVFAPTTLYDAGHATQIVPAGAAHGLETNFRPHFFTGVATVVAKLFQIMPADLALLGEKDYQQLAVIRQLVRDLDLPIEIIAGATVREASGLALSSRNSYLCATEKQIAPQLYATLMELKGKLETGRAFSTLEADANAALRQAGFSKIDYLALCDAKTLAPLDMLEEEGRLLAAVWCGDTRLIDNIAVMPNS